MTVGSWFIGCKDSTVDHELCAMNHELPFAASCFTIDVSRLTGFVFKMFLKSLR